MRSDDSDISDGALSAGNDHREGNVQSIQLASHWSSIYISLMNCENISKSSDSAATTDSQ